MAAHLYICPNNGKVRLFAEEVDELEKWIKKQTRPTQKPVIGSHFTLNSEAPDDSKTLEECLPT